MSLQKLYNDIKSGKTEANIRYVSSLLELKYGYPNEITIGEFNRLNITLLEYLEHLILAYSLQNIVPDINSNQFILALKTAKSIYIYEDIDDDNNIAFKLDNSEYILTSIYNDDNNMFEEWFYQMVNFFACEEIKIDIRLVRNGIFEDYGIIYINNIAPVNLKTIYIYHSSFLDYILNIDVNKYPYFPQLNEWIETNTLDGIESIHIELFSIENSHENMNLYALIRNNGPKTIYYRQLDIDRVIEQHLLNRKLLTFSDIENREFCDINEHYKKNHGIIRRDLNSDQEKYYQQSHSVCINSLLLFFNYLIDNVTLINESDEESEGDEESDESET